MDRPHSTARRILAATSAIAFTLLALPSSLVAASPARPALGVTHPLTAVHQPAAAPRRNPSHPGPSVTCPPNGTWVGFTGTNTDINLEYESSGGQTAPNGCSADDETLTIPTSGLVPSTITIPYTVDATAGDPIIVNTAGTLVVSCKETASTWNVCVSGQRSATLDDESGDITVKSGGTMEIAPGARLYMSGNAIAVQSSGTLLAQGSTLQAPVGENPSPGNWNGIDFNSGSNGTLTSVTVDSAGDGFTSSEGCSACYGDVVVTGTAKVSITSSHIDNSYGDGILITGNGDPTLTSDTMTYCTNCALGDSSGVAVHYQAIPGDLTGKLSGLVATGYGSNAVELGDNQTSGTLGTTATWPAAGIPYLVTDNLNIIGGGALTILSGVTMRMDDVNLYVQSGGSLHVDGAGRDRQAGDLYQRERLHRVALFSPAG